jgi:fluoride exporter
MPSVPRTLRERWDVLAVVSAGGALGSLARWWLAQLLPHDPGHVAWSTFVTNLSGALLLGLLMAFMLDRLSATRWVRPFLGVGVLGGYTTFSTYMLDTRALLAAGRPASALAYLGGTLVGGLLLVWVGLVVGRGLLLVVDRAAARRSGHELSEGSGTRPVDPGVEPRPETRQRS